MSMFNDISWSDDNEQECESITASRFPPGRWSLLGPGSEKKWYSTHEDRPKGEWDRVAELMMIKFGESWHPVFRPRVHCLKERLKAKEVVSIQFCADGDTIETVFRTIVSVNQLSIYGAVADLCEDYKACHVGTERLVLAGQSDPLFEPVSLLTKTPTPSTDDPVQEGRLSQQNRGIKICTDAGFLTTVGVGQYFTTKDTEEFSQFTESVACREYTLPRDGKSSDPRGGIRGNTKIGPVLEVTTSYLQGKYGVEIRIESMHKDHSHSWVWISHGLNLEQQRGRRQRARNLWDEVRRICVEDECTCFSEPIKGQSKTTKTFSACSSTRTVPVCERSLTDIEPETYSPIAYPMSKRLSTLLRHGHLPREEDGAIAFCRLKDYLRNEFEHSQHWSDEMRKSRIATRTDFNIVPIHEEKKFFTSELFKIIQDAIPLILHNKTMYKFRKFSPNTFFSTSDVRSICTPSQIQDWYQEDKFSAQRNGILYVCGSYEQRAQRSEWHWPGSTTSCMAPTESGKYIKTRRVGGWHQTCSTERISIILHATLPAQCIPKAILRRKLEKSCTRKFLRHLDLLQRFPLRIIGWKNWIGWTLCNNSKVPNKSNPNPKPNFQARWDLWVDNQPVCSHSARK